MFVIRERLYADPVYQTCFHDSHGYRPCVVEDDGVVVGSTSIFAVALLKERFVGKVASYFQRGMSSPQSWC